MKTKTLQVPSIIIALLLNTFLSFTQPSRALTAEITINADFTFEGDSSCAQTPIKFTSIVSGGNLDYKYRWSFGDEDNSNQKDPVHEFFASGCSGISSFNVKMHVTDADGRSASVQKTVHVKTKPYLHFTDSENPLSPFKYCSVFMVDPSFKVTLKNQTLDVSCITSYSIDWGDGNVVHNATSPLGHIYNKAGAFKLLVTAENTSGCDLTWNQFVYVQNSTAAGIESFGETEGCSPVEFAYRLLAYENNSPGTTYTWDFGDGSPRIVWNHNDLAETGDTIKHVYNRSSCEDENGNGYFTTILKVENGCDSKSASVDKIRVYKKPEARIGAGDLMVTDTIYTTDAIRLFNNTTSGYYGTSCTKLTQYSWDFNNGITSGSEDMPDMQWPVPGVYNIVLNAGNPCGISTDTFKLVVILPAVTDINNTIMESGFLLYPNPAKSYVYFKSPEQLEDQVITIRINDNSGKTIRLVEENISKYHNDKIDISDLKPGVYFIDFIGREFNFKEKFIKL